MRVETNFTVLRSRAVTLLPTASGTAMLKTPTDNRRPPKIVVRRPSYLPFRAWGRMPGDGWLRQRFPRRCAWLPGWRSVPPVSHRRGPHAQALRRRTLSIRQKRPHSAESWRSDSDVIQRFRNQTRTTALAEEPILLRILKSAPQSSGDAEVRFQRLLEPAGHHGRVARTAGREWFVTITRFLDGVARALSLLIEVVMSRNRRGCLTDYF